MHSRLLPVISVALCVALCAAASGVLTTFEYDPSMWSVIRSVSVRGAFNGWDETPMSKGDDGTWSVTLDLTPGEYEYKYFINGRWTLNMETEHHGDPVDKEADGYAQDGYGGQNAVRVVKATGKVPAGSRALSGAVSVWEPEQVLPMGTKGSSIVSLAFSGDGTKVAAGSLFGELFLWDAETGKRLWKIEADPTEVRAVAFSPDDTVVAAIGETDGINLWRVSDGKLIKILGRWTWGKTVGFSPDGRLLAVGGKHIKIVDLGSSREIAVLEQPRRKRGGVEALSFSPGGGLLAAGGWSDLLTVWTTADWREVFQIETDSRIRSLAFTPDGDTIVTGHDDGRVRLWNARDGNATETIDTGSESVGYVGVTPDGVFLIYGARQNKSMYVWSFASNALRTSWQPYEPNNMFDGAVRVAALSPMGDKVVTAPDGFGHTLFVDQEVAVWDASPLVGTQAAGMEVAAGDVTKRVPEAPPRLKITDVRFVEPSGNQCLDAEERAYVEATVVNEGSGFAFDVKPSVDIPSSTRGLSRESARAISSLAPGQSEDVRIAVSASLGVEDGDVALVVECSEANRFDADPVKLTIPTRAFVPPDPAFVDFGFESEDGGNLLRPGRQGFVTMRLQNRGGGKAENVSVTVRPRFPADVFVPGQAEFALGEMSPGQYQDATFMFFVNRDYRGDEVEFVGDITESRGKYGSEFTIEVPFHKPVAQLAEIVVEGKESPAVAVTQAPELAVDVETDIPTGRRVNRDAVAVVIGISQYLHDNVPSVDYAVRDAEVVRQYLETTLGYDPANVLFATDADATLAQLTTMIDGRLRNYVKPGVSDVFFYYSGHGAPDPESNTAYFVPYDCDPDYAERSGYALERLYEVVESLDARTATVVIDACFSGLEGVSPLYIEVERPDVPESAVVFTSSSGSELSTWYPEKRHSVFTYYFLKGLQGDADSDGDGELTAGELGDYVQEQVPRRARVLKNRDQRPSMVGDRKRILVEYGG